MKEITRLKMAWALLAVWGRLKAWLNCEAGAVRRACIIAGFIGIGILISRFAEVAITKDILTNYLVAAGAMIGGAIAIVLSISIFLLQGVADLYSSKFFEEYANDWRQQTTYLGVAAIVLGLFGLALHVASLSQLDINDSRIVIVSSLTLIGTFFALIDWQVQIVRRKVTPENAIVFLEEKAMRSLRDVRKTAERAAKILSLQMGDVSEDLALAAAYGSVAQPSIHDLDRQIETLVGISLKLVERKESETAKVALAACARVLAGYIQARQASTVAIVSIEVFLAIQSDSQQFLNRNFERLNRAGRQFIKDGLDDLSSYIVDVYRVVAEKAKDVRALNNHPENPILDTVVGYLKQYVDSGVEDRDVEVVFQGAVAYGNIAVMAALVGQETTLFGLQELLEALVIPSLQLGTTIIVDQCTTACLEIIAAAFGSEHINRKHAVEKALMALASIATILSNLAGMGQIPNDFATVNSIEKGFTDFRLVLGPIIKRYRALKEEIAKKKYRRDLVMLFESARSSIRKISAGTKNAESLLAGMLGRLVFDLNNLILKLMATEEFADVRDDLRNVVTHLSHEPYFFTHAAGAFDAGSNSVRDLVDAVAKTGIAAMQRLRDNAIAKECASSIASIVNQALTKNTNSHGYDEPRLMKEVCYIGILALKHGWTDILDVVKAKIGEFESKYVEKYFSTPPSGYPGTFDPYNHTLGGLAHADQLHRELVRWMNEFDQERMSGLLSIRNDAEAAMYDLIEADDIQIFIENVWGT